MKKKWLTTLGLITLAFVPATAIVSCSNESGNNKTNSDAIKKYDDTSVSLINQNEETYSKLSKFLTLDEQNSCNLICKQIVNTINGNVEDSLSSSDVQIKVLTKLKELNEKQMEELLNVAFASLSNVIKSSVQLAPGYNTSDFQRNEISIKKLRFNNSDHTRISFELAQTIYSSSKIIQTISDSETKEIDVLRSLNSIVYKFENIKIESFAYEINNKVLPSFKFSEQQPEEAKITVSSVSNPYSVSSTKDEISKAIWNLVMSFEGYQDYVTSEEVNNFIDENYQYYVEYFYNVFYKVQQLELSTKFNNNFLTKVEIGGKESNIPYIQTLIVEPAMNPIYLGWSWLFEESNEPITKEGMDLSTLKVKASPTIFNMPVLFSTITDDNIEFEIYNLIN